jgi:hypothetical protein
MTCLRSSKGQLNREGRSPAHTVQRFLDRPRYLLGNMVDICSSRHLHGFHGFGDDIGRLGPCQGCFHNPAECIDQGKKAFVHDLGELDVVAGILRGRVDLVRYAGPPTASSFCAWLKSYHHNFEILTIGNTKTGSISDLEKKPSAENDIPPNRALKCIALCIYKDSKPNMDETSLIPLHLGCTTNRLGCMGPKAVTT